MGTRFRCGFWKSEGSPRGPFPCPQPEPSKMTRYLMSLHNNCDSTCSFSTRRADDVVLHHSTPQLLRSTNEKCLLTALLASIAVRVAVGGESLLLTASGGTIRASARRGKLGSSQQRNGGRCAQSASSVDGERRGIWLLALSQFAAFTTRSCVSGWRN